MKQMQQGHIYAFDVMRLVAAFFVVMIHCAASRSVSGLVYNTVARFSVPVFVLISGYILLPSDRETGYFLQKCVRTFGTLLLTAGLYACYQLLTGRMVDTGVKALMKTLLCEPSHLWYLYAAMALYLLTPLLRVFHRHARRQEYVYALAFCFFFGSVVYTLVYSGWFPVVNQLMDNTKGPCLVLNQNPDGSLSGSGRSPAWYPFLTQLQACGFPCVAAGHEGAFGIKFFDRASVDAYFSMVQTDLVEQLKDVDLEQFQFRPDFVIDTSGNGDVGIDIVAFLEFLDEVERYKPFGVAFEEPHILLRFRPEEATWQVLGSMKQHLKMILPYGFEVLVWNAADEITRKDSSEPVVLQGRLGINHFRGNDTVQFVGSFAS